MSDVNESTSESGEDADRLRELVLVKRDQRFVFRYAPGEEQEMLQALVRMAQDPTSDIDWFDAAVLSHQIGQRIGQQLERLMKTSTRK